MTQGRQDCAATSQKPPVAVQRAKFVAVHGQQTLPSQQIGLFWFPAQLLSSRQPTHAPVSASQNSPAGFPVQSVFDEHPVQVFASWPLPPSLLVAHTGVFGFVQSLLPRHCTHWLSVVSQYGWSGSGKPQSALDVHPVLTHWPCWHADPAWQSVSVLQLPQI